MSKSKVMKVITTCSDCEHKRDLVEIGGNTFYSSVCAFAEDIRDDDSEPFMVFYATEHPKHYRIDIPDNCPLDDYESEV